MKKTIAVLTVLFLLVLLAGCTSGEKHEKVEESVTKDAKEEGRVQIIEQDGFVFTLSSDQKAYKKGEEIKVQAFIEYTGEKKKVEISHSNPMITYIVTDEERNILMPPAAALDMKMSSQFKKGQKRFLLKQSIDTNVLDVVDGSVFIEAVVRFHEGEQEYVLKNTIEMNVSEEVPQEVSETGAGFVFTLVSDKKIYTKGEKVKLKGYMTYTEDEENMTIIHSSPMITYSVKDEKGNEEEKVSSISAQEIMLFTPFQKDEKILMIEREIDTSEISAENGTFTIDGLASFSDNGVRYLIQNQLTFQLEEDKKSK